MRLLIQAANPGPQCSIANRPCWLEYPLTKAPTLSDGDAVPEWGSWRFPTIMTRVAFRDCPLVVGDFDRGDA